MVEFCPIIRNIIIVLILAFRSIILFIQIANDFTVTMNHIKHVH